MAPSPGAEMGAEASPSGFFLLSLSSGRDAVETVGKLLPECTERWVSEM